MWPDPRLGFRETLLEKILTDGGIERWLPPKFSLQPRRPERSDSHPRTAPSVDARAMGVGFFDASQAMQGAGDFGNVAFGEGQGCQGCQGFGWNRWLVDLHRSTLGIAR